MNRQIATFGGGCFWCMVEPFDTMPGVISVVSGYSGGDSEYPTYEQVKTQKTGHVEVVQIEFDADIMSYDKLLTIYWQQTDPTDKFGQFVDRGSSYRPVIFYHTEEQRVLAEESKQALEQSGRFDKPIVTAIEPFKHFYLAEDYHQNFYKKSPEHYQRSHIGSGREQFIQNYWKK
ncbi:MULTISPECIES: peptide-methionine (S)-S-oxide reductase MsrA [unclassified Granulicatella]|uniref:peptide-methionine (S)-S-oxide reductase MsrA n=1 Tax=unclassified Granulicatella TaxID=2630493 RepID=UPI0010737523|nr:MULTISPECIES: peptide-methionine (S)-S-oxide reductase MsrA [unclassified Granulicatella]MBF0780952.1 peptide-methionine (S)-S-oxide reductase MsrA [Granulicatella sp. 19428wC4_WM01]TFU92973.1 peptide-methionine (S)-S-oxide reductase MsrA [Granulicatella sp. WM01]